ncbi:DUF4339 domain-containing protein [Gimesia maris]|uniref:DUF4339 domain-containing protein n=1 Tax=Gimesia maris TaxID=122 RepID=UPI0030DD7730|tara:strand:+ start:131559 stop:132329 length:771 start_codon:yes stop_codon:yes gene_type:complete
MSKKLRWYCMIDGKEVGPVGSGQIKKWLVDSTLRLTDKIRREDSEWKEVSEFPKLVELIVPAKADPISNSNWKSKAASIDKFVFGDVLNSKYPEWVPESLVSYTSYLRWVAYLIVSVCIPLIVIMVFVRPKGNIDFSTFGKVGILPIILMGIGMVFTRSHLVKFQNRFLNGDGEIFLGMSFLCIVFGLMLPFTGVMFIFGTAPNIPVHIQVPLGIVLFIWSIATFAPWGYFAVKYHKHFKDKKDDLSSSESEATIE